jgi:hypothetical protein
MADIGALNGMTSDEAARLRTAGVTTGDDLLEEAIDVSGLAGRCGLSEQRLRELVATQAEKSVEEIAQPGRMHLLGLVRATLFAAILGVAGVAVFATVRLIYAAPPTDDSAVVAATKGRFLLTIRLATAPVSAVGTPFEAILYSSPKEPNLSSAQAFGGVNVLSVRTENNATVASVAVDRATADAIAGAAAASEFYLTWPAPRAKERGSNGHHTEVPHAVPESGRGSGSH